MIEEYYRIKNGEHDTQGDPEADADMLLEDYKNKRIKNYYIMHQIDGDPYYIYTEKEYKADNDGDVELVSIVTRKKN